ncbi:MAG: TonB family protein [Bacteroidetes bacterium]|nr:MAG: TonB family protein [Bacteroidota bacterium]
MNIPMRLAIILFFFIIKFCSAQPEILKNICNLDSMKTLDGQEVLWIADEAPSFPGGELKLKSFINKEFKYASKKEQWAKELVLTLLIDSKGYIRHYCIRESEFINTDMRESLEQEALRVVSKMPRWTPALHAGKAVPAFFNLSFLENKGNRQSLQFSSSEKFQQGEIKDGYKVGVWSYYDINPEKTVLKVDYDSGKLLYLIQDTTDYIIKSGGNWISSKLDIQPRFIGSMNEFYNIITAQLYYPLLARTRHTSGQFYLSFEIDTLGSIGNIEIINDIGDGCSTEAIRALKHIPNLWIPAQKKNEKYSSRFILPFNFILKSGAKYFSASWNTAISDSIYSKGKLLNTIFIGASAIHGKDTVESGKQDELILPHVDPDKKVYQTVEEVPSFPGGEGEMFSFILKNTIYPPSAMEHGIQGRVYVRFVVDTMGIILDAKVIKGIGGGCDEEALRVVNSMPVWQPGRQEGKIVQVQYTLPISFTMEVLPKREEDFILDTYSFNSTLRFQIDRIVKDDFNRGNTMDYSVGENNLTLMFSIDENGQPGNFQPLNTWGRQFIGSITRAIRTQVDFPKQTKTMYFHLMMRFNEGHMYNYNFILSEKREHTF